MKTNFSLKRRDGEAWAIEYQLRLLKQWAKKYQNAIKNNGSIENLITYNIYKNFLDNVNDIMIANSHSKGLTPWNLFYRSHNSFNYSGKNYANIFEEELAAVVAALELYGQNPSKQDKQITIQKALYGTAQAPTVITDQYINGKFQAAFRDKTGEMIQGVAKAVGTKVKNISTSLENTTVKIDVSSETANIELSHFNNSLYGLAEAIKDKTFTVKDYKSFKNTKMAGTIWEKNPSDIKLRLSEGGSNLFRSVTGAMTEIGLPYEMILHMYFRGMNHMMGNHTKNDYSQITKEHFSHLRKIYELRGSGILDKNSGQARVADFIIWNDPDTEMILVKSTASLIDDWFNDWSNNQTASNLFSEIKISAASLD